VLAALVFSPQALPAPPEAPDLVTASDTGSSTTDNVTNDTTPDFTVANSTGATIRLCIVTAGGTGTPTSHGTSTANPAAFTATTLAAGSYDVTARSGSTDCATGEVSSALTITVDTTAPTIASAPALLDFVGSSSTVTFTSTPRFKVIVEPLAVVTLYESGTAIGSATSTADGSAQVLVSTPLADGTHTVDARAVDAAGNQSSASSSVTITVDSTAASATAPDLLDDDGTSATDNYTTNPRPRFTVTTEANARVTLYENGIALGAATADANGVATVRPRDTHWLDPGVHCVYAIAMDALANSGTETPELCVTIAPGVAPFTSNLGVDLTGQAVALSLRSTLKASARVKVLAHGRVVAKASRTLAARKRTKFVVRLAPSARKARRLMVVTTFRSSDGRRIVLRRLVRR
jgi:hypothetical protein